MIRRQRLGVGDVEAGAGDLLAVERIDQRAVTTLRPRATLMKYALGFIFAKNAASKMPVVCA